MSILLLMVHSTRGMGARMSQPSFQFQQDVGPTAWCLGAVHTLSREGSSHLTCLHAGKLIHVKVLKPELCGAPTSRLLRLPSLRPLQWDLTPISTSLAIVHASWVKDLALDLAFWPCPETGPACTQTNYTER